MVKPRACDIGFLVLAVTAMLAGISALQSGEADQFGIAGISGGHARLFGWLSIVFAVLVFLIYWRGVKQR